MQTKHFRNIHQFHLQHLRGQEYSSVQCVCRPWKIYLLPAGVVSCSIFYRTSREKCVHKGQFLMGHMQKGGPMSHWVETGSSKICSTGFSY